MEGRIREGPLNKQCHRMCRKSGCGMGGFSCCNFNWRRKHFCTLCKWQREISERAPHKNIATITLNATYFSDTLSPPCLSTTTLPFLHPLICMMLLATVGIVAATVHTQLCCRLSQKERSRGGGMKGLWAWLELFKCRN